MALRVNGELRQHSSAGKMFFTVPEAIAWISSFLILEPGDLICMGTPGGVGETTQTYLRSGDVVEASVEGLAVSINSVE
jgi:2-keto-4-pentenoate hydratase/2-oxohepta-3-ene-1,7-dioic acid hydratase in catechol pathway